MQGRHLLLAAMMAASAYSVQGAEGSAEAGKQKNSACVGCHGIPGYRTSFPEVYSVPKLGGQYPEYIISALQAYKSGERSHASMQAIAGSLTEQDMADFAAYYGGAQ